jgi:hypothetical protein
MEKPEFGEHPHASGGPAIDGGAVLPPGRPRAGGASDREGASASSPARQRVARAVRRINKRLFVATAKPCREVPAPQRVALLVFGGVI